MDNEGAGNELTVLMTLPELLMMVMISVEDIVSEEGSQDRWISNCPCGQMAGSRPLCRWASLLG